MTRAYCRRINKDRRQVPLSSFDQHGILCTLQCRFLAVLQFSICLSVRSFLNILAVCSRTSILEELGIQVFFPLFHTFKWRLSQLFNLSPSFNIYHLFQYLSLSLNVIVRMTWSIPLVSHLLRFRVHRLDRFVRDEQLNHFTPYIHSHSFSYLGEEKIPFFWDNCYVNGLGKNHHQQTDEFAEKTFIYSLPEWLSFSEGRQA